MYCRGTVKICVFSRGARASLENCLFFRFENRLKLFSASPLLVYMTPGSGELSIFSRPRQGLICPFWPRLFAIPCQSRRPVQLVIYRFRLVEDVSDPVEDCLADLAVKLANLLKSHPACFKPGIPNALAQEHDLGTTFGHH